jgi:hypothetical protein
MILWPKIIEDRDTLNKVYSILFSKIVNMRLLIAQRFGPFYGGTFDKIFDNYAMSMVYMTRKLLKHVDTFRNSSMVNESQELMDAFWNIYKECMQQAFPELFIYGWEFDYKKDGL